MPLDASLANEDYCYLTTTGRVTGKPHTVEIWFGLAGETLYMLSGAGAASPDGTGARADWVRNLQKQPRVQVRLGNRTLTGIARVVRPATDEDRLARRLLVEKYQARNSDDLGGWSRASLPVAVDLEASGGG